MQGLHIIADLADCPPSVLLTSATRLESLCRDACARAGLSILGTHFHQFASAQGGAGGVTGALVLAESHLAIHTWPEHCGATLDIYVCNHSVDNSAKAEAAFAMLRDALAPADLKARRIWRGGARGTDVPLQSPAAEPLDAAG
ncbi:MAG: adenosylmethionine decarboxylase [Burkholderiales bacterium]